MKEWLLIFRNVIIALVVIGIGEAIPQMQALENWIAPRRTDLTWMTAGVTLAGWALLVGAVIYRIWRGGGSLNRREIEATVKSVKDSQSMPYSFRVSKYWIPKKAWGAGFSDEVTIAQFKAAFSQGLCLRDSRWFGLLMMGLGAMFMALGGFGLIIVLAAPGLKFLAGSALCYAVVRTTWAFVRA